MNIFCVFLFFLMGLLCGTLLNLIINAVSMDGKRSLVATCCTRCQTRWNMLYLMPVAGYFFTKGYCPSCKAKTTVRVPLVEFSVGLIFALLHWKYGLSWELWMLILYFAILIILLVTDLERYLLPNVITYPAVLLALALSLAVMLMGYSPQWAWNFANGGIMAIMNNYFINALVGGLSGALLLFAVAVISRGGMALGDVKLAGLMGLMMGFPLIMVALFLGVIAGGLVAIGLIVSKRKKRKEMMPFGPFICMASMVTLVWGKDLLTWYLS